MGFRLIAFLDYKVFFLIQVANEKKDFGMTSRLFVDKQHPEDKFKENDKICFSLCSNLSN